MNDVKASGQRSSRSAAPSPNPARTELSAALPAVLLVDDQPARLLTYESILQGVGVTCERALSGREALEKLLRQSYAVILLDISMPEMDGYETARFIREHPKFERTPIIFITGVHLSELDTLKGYEAGAIDYISVPIVPEILRSKVALLVELYRRRTELETLNSELAGYSRATRGGTQRGAGCRRRTTGSRLAARRKRVAVGGAEQHERGGVLHRHEPSLHVCQSGGAARVRSRAAGRRSCREPRRRAGSPASRRHAAPAGGGTAAARAAG